MRIDKVDLRLSRPAKDFGKAFYLSSEFDQAKEMAVFRCQSLGGEVVVNEFAFDESLLSELKCQFFDGYSEEWARFILSNRDSREMVHDYDVVYGPIADDRIGRQVFNFKAGYIDFETFIQRIQYFNGITYQWAFCTEKAVALLKKI